METKGKMKMKIGKYTCRCNFKIVGLTESAIEDMNKILAKEENANGKSTGYGVRNDSMLP